ncbi:MAG: dihydrofolate reductase [Erysipelotrichaceae bacterium]
MLSLIVALAADGAIGKNGWMPWDIKEDLALFKSLTLNHNLIMGSTTFLGLPKPLAKRHTYVITTRNDLPSYDNVTYINDFKSFLVQAQKADQEYFVCGGANIYRQALEFVDKLYLSHVKGTFEADTYFPKIDYDKFKVIKEVEYADFIFKEYQRK